jgi:hypothetical protein
VQKGTIVSHREVAARWSYSEITGRFATEYSQRHLGSISADLISKITSGVPFDSLSDPETQLLAAWFDTGYRQDYANAFNGWYTQFRCESWTKSQLARVHTLPIIDPLGQRRQLAFMSYSLTPGGSWRTVRQIHLMPLQRPITFRSRHPSCRMSH